MDQFYIIMNVIVLCWTILDKCMSKGLDGFNVQMVGGLVQNQEVGIVSTKYCKQDKNEDDKIE